MTDRARGRFQTKDVPNRAFVSRARDASPPTRASRGAFARVRSTDSIDRVRTLASRESTAME